MKFRLFILFFVMVQAVMAQSFTVSSTIDSTSIRIGEQTLYKLSVTQPSDMVVVIPNLKDSLVKGVEIIEKQKADTVSLADKKICVTNNFLVTSFDSGFYVIPAYTCVANGDTVMSNTVTLDVTTVKLDEKSEEIKAIKPEMKAPFSWTEVAIWSGFALSGLLLLAAVVLIVVHFIRKRKPRVKPAVVQPKIAPHVLALSQLAKMKEEKAWFVSDIKGYYTNLTDVLRTYCHGQFGINAMELTTDEILSLVKKEPALSDVRSLIARILELADLVKFAKVIPVEHENEQCLLDAFEIVEKTKPQEDNKQV